MSSLIPNACSHSLFCSRILVSAASGSSFSVLKVEHGLLRGEAELLSLREYSTISCRAPKNITSTQVHARNPK